MISINLSESRSGLQSHVAQASSSPIEVECDFCGRVVRRDAAFERVQRADEDVETVYLCAGCEFGSD